MFYEFNQNNSGGSFVVTDTLCDTIIIEADNESEAVDKAEELGCYWDGVADGFDCPCCGDRWSKDWLKPMEVEKYTTTGMSVGVYGNIYNDPAAQWHKQYGAYEIVEQPTFKKNIIGMDEYRGTIRFKDMEEYVQYYANEYGWTTPAVRIFYKDGHVTEIYKKKRCD